MDVRGTGKITGPRKAKNLDTWRLAWDVSIPFALQEQISRFVDQEF